MIISTIFAPNWFRMNISVIWIKRESGVNPGQSRCCEALLKSWKEPLPLILCLYIGKASRSGVSQKTCHSLKSVATRGIRGTVRTYNCFNLINAKGMPMKKVCPRCGATFDCMHNDILSCHCATVRLDALQRTYLMENYSDCLCHDCLKAVKDSFYACEINPRYNKKKNDKESIDCKQR